ncbi:hypothetical protein F2P56_034577 [Juglans regia]|uniref:DUF4283 domain-containing protein n=1 Tax=Juglans regia TaxID=51240 RepID=A0A833SPU2_JUGRE|nr:hypothetical protein F2P56_034577 [Juglans regia]
MEEMEEVWKRLKLNDEEDCPIEIRRGVCDSMEQKGERSLIGKIISERRIGKEVARSMMEKVWKVGKPLEFQEIGGNCFVITFANRRDKWKVLDGCPWLFDSYLFVLLDFNGGLQPSLFDFDHAYLWVQMLNLPLSYMNKQMGELIGSSMGKVSEVDVQKDGSAWGKCLRVKVECDLRKPVARGRTIAVDGRKIWVPFQYEKLPRLCFSCGRIVHGKDGCKESEGSVGQYGVWLRALPQNRRGAVKVGEQKGGGRGEERGDCPDHVHGVNDEERKRENQEEGRVKEVSEEGKGVDDVYSQLCENQELRVKPQEIMSIAPICVRNDDQEVNELQKDILLVGKLSSIESEQNQECTRASRWKRRARARPEPSKSSSIISGVKRGTECVGDGDDMRMEGKKMKSYDDMVCDDGLGVVAAV